ncbi:cytochrome c3 family protein [bacterium]|nr:cytochrome c3 family protein [bacterium]
MSRRGIPGAIWIVLLLLAVAPVAWAQDWTTEDCLDCHSESDGDMPVVGLEHLAKSIHVDLDCVDCHMDIEDLPHEEQIPAVNCGECHDDVAEQYQRHGFGKVGVAPDIPTCTDCHNTHDIRLVMDKASPVNPLNLPETCGNCHEDGGFTESHGIRFKHPVKVYTNSVHGKAALGGIYSAATCNDCHSTDGSSHKILPPGDVSSPINHFNIAATCGKCHKYIEQDYNEGIHGILTMRGQVESPICTTCHGEHNILLTDDPRSPVSSSRLAEATCSPCHESASLNEKYELPTGRLLSFQDSYHGLKSKAGDQTVANCASCHGAHRILPSSNPTSTVHPDNLQHTCGDCHPDISAKIAQTAIHDANSGLHTGVAGIVRVVYLVLIFGVIGGMALHWLIDLRKQVKNVMKKKDIRRMEGDEVVQHFILALSFTLLVISGFSLRFYDVWWSEMLFSWEGGAAFRGDLHRISGVIMLLASVWHLFFLGTERGKQFLRDMWPKWEDAKQAFQMMGYNLGIVKDHPQFGRFSYVEKAEYWALVWGTAVMGLTGFMLWFDNLFVTWLPKGFLDVALVIHYYEAWLAFLAILIWHMYSTVFSPNVYPMNPSWLTGYMPREQFEKEHPLAMPKEEDETSESEE